MIKYKLLLLLLIVNLNLISTTTSSDTTTNNNPCVSLENCSSCIRNPACSWCSQSDYHGPTKHQLPRCNVLTGHQLPGFACDSRSLFTPENYLKVERNDTLSGQDGQRAVPMQPQKLSMRLKVGEPVSFELKYKEVEDYPLDMYYLMDGTYTMKDDKEVLANVGKSIGETLSNLTSRYRIGFGTFVDKTTMPFVSTVREFWENPCYVRNYTCVTPYGFKNHMKLNSDTSGFSDIVQNVVLSASTDLPEGGFDALMQVMVCDNAIGWSEQARRLVLFATDAPFHYAGDGWLGGMLLPNDGLCHMDEKGEYYTHSLLQDYPSMALINSKAKQNSVTLIFAVTSDQIHDYQVLTSVLEGAKATELAKNSSNIVKLIEDEYKKITTKVEIKDTFPSEYFDVKYFTTCIRGGDQNEKNSCDGLTEGAVVEFRVEINLKKCPAEKNEWKRQYRVYAVGVPDGLDIEVEMLCDCPCEDKNHWKPNSPLCNYKGSETCGLCVCDNNYFGRWCECNADGAHGKVQSNCKLGNSSEACSGRGTCICGQCQCSKRYSGTYCECDNENCELVNKLLCAGNGICDCGECQCNPGWEGKACDCSTSKETCMRPGDTEQCSNQGTCVCGQCTCRGKYSGQYCEKCLHESCPTHCEELKHCVQCKMYGTGIYDPSDCELNCYVHTITKVDVVSVYPVSDEHNTLCKHHDPSDSCTFIFSYKKDIRNNKSFDIKAQITKECPPVAPIFWILTAVASLVVLIGLVCFCAYKIARKMRIKREYSRFERDKTREKWAEETNPLYNSPVNTFQNPMYNGHDKNS